MLGKKARQHNTTERQSNTTQHNTTRPRQLFSKKTKKKLPRVGFEPTTVRLLGVRSYQLSYRGSSAGWARITYTIQSNQSITNQINWWTQCMFIYKAQSQWIRESLFDGHSNYLYCYEFILELDQRLARQCKTLCLHPVITKSKREVTCSLKLEKFVALSSDDTNFKSWWRDPDDDEDVEVHYPHEKHGLQGILGKFSSARIHIYTCIYHLHTISYDAFGLQSWWEVHYLVWWKDKDTNHTISILHGYIKKTHWASPMDS